MARKALIQFRRDTAANWTSTNPTLAAGETGYETDTGKFKIGNGTNTWGLLPYTQVNINGVYVPIGGTSTTTTNTVTADASTLTGTTLKSTVVSSSLTSVGTLTGLTMGGTLAMGSNNITGTGTITATTFTGTLAGSISGTGAVTVASGGSNTNVTLTPQGTGVVTVSSASTTSGTAAVRNISISTSAPSGGSDGDVWLVYTP